MSNNHPVPLLKKNSPNLKNLNGGHQFVVPESKASPQDNVDALLQWRKRVRAMDNAHILVKMCYSIKLAAGDFFTKFNNWLKSLRG